MIGNFVEQKILNSILIGGQSVNKDASLRADILYDGILFEVKSQNRGLRTPNGRTLCSKIANDIKFTE